MYLYGNSGRQRVKHNYYATFMAIMHSVKIRESFKTVLNHEFQSIIYFVWQNFIKQIQTEVKNDKRQDISLHWQMSKETQQQLSVTQKCIGISTHK